MRDAIIHLGILLCGSLLFFCSLRTIPLSVVSSIVLMLLFIGTVVYSDPDLLPMLHKYRKLKQAAKTSNDLVLKEGE